MALFKRPCMYSKVNKEDPAEVFHRRAKFLIYKTLQEMDLVSRRSSPTLLFLRLKVEIGKSLTKLRRSVVSELGGLRKHCQSGVRALKKMFHIGATKGLTKPIFTLEV